MAKFKVIEPKGGFYIGRRRFGQVFEAPDDFPEKWVVKVSEDATSEVGEVHKAKPLTLAEAGKQAGVDAGQIDLA